MTERWHYKVQEIKPGMFGLKAGVVEAELQTLGQQGWELVDVVQTAPWQPVLLFLKRRA
ncbi:DUF4177 domain-containing protein [Luteimonas sp. FCS-9]|uniref:DUF4177 domain-containing protein n=1 Tax=Luteimonas sp. FCS-9 TaxID=1547516 RepID=UPI000A560048|nr:DUF4177 domain-containing protein [Luteimonas sp. FCS-9]